MEYTFAPESGAQNALKIGLVERGSWSQKIKKQQDVFSFPVKLLHARACTSHGISSHPFSHSLLRAACPPQSRRRSRTPVCTKRVAEGRLTFTHIRRPPPKQPTPGKSGCVCFINKEHSNPRALWGELRPGARRPCLQSGRADYSHSICITSCRPAKHVILAAMCLLRRSPLTPC